jgi:hypothetical protein
MRKWKVQSKDVLISVLTSAQHHNTRLKQLMGTWGKHVRWGVIASDEASKEHNTTAVVTQKGRDQLGKKSQKIWKMMCKEDAKWYGTVDDDTFLILHNLLEALNGPRLANYDDKFYIGYTLTHTPVAFVGGGGGIFLSRGTMKALCAESEKSNPCNDASIPDGQAGDIATSNCMVHLGVQATHQDGFYPFPPDKMVEPAPNWCTETWWVPKHITCPPVERAISFHYVDQAHYRLLYYLTYTLLSH